MKSCVRLVATLVALGCPFVWSAVAAQESTPSPSDLPSLDRATEFLHAVDDGASSSPANRRTSLEGVRLTGGSITSWRQRVATAPTPDASIGGGDRPAGGGSEALPSGNASGLDLPDFLPARLRQDLHRMEARIRELRTVLFGQRGIFRLGEDAESGESRFRLNLQYDPEPGLRFVLLTH